MTPILLQTENGSRPVQVAFLSFRDATAYIRDVRDGLMAQGIALSHSTSQRVTTVLGRSVFIQGA